MLELLHNSSPKMPFFQTDLWTCVCLQERGVSDVYQPRMTYDMLVSHHIYPEYELLTGKYCWDQPHTSNSKRDMWEFVIIPRLVLCATVPKFSESRRDTAIWVSFSPCILSEDLVLLVFVSVKQFCDHRSANLRVYIYVISITYLTVKQVDIVELTVLSYKKNY